MCLSVWRFTWCKRTNELIREALVDNLLINEESSLKSRTRNYAVLSEAGNSGLKIEVIPTAKFRKKGRGLLFSKALFEGLIFGEAYIRRGLSTEGNLRFKIDWANLIVRGKFREIYHFCFVLPCIWGQFSKYKPPGGLYLEERFNGGFFALPVWGTYTWSGLFSELWNRILPNIGSKVNLTP